MKKRIDSEIEKKNPLHLIGQKKSQQDKKEMFSTCLQVFEERKKSGTELENR